MDKLRKFYYEKQLRRKKIAACLLLAIMAEANEPNLQRKERVWVKNWIARRKEKGLHHNLFLELILEDPSQFRRCLRMSTDTFENLLKKVTPLISKQQTHLRESISACERLSVTLRHLATGETLQSLSLTFRISKSTLSGIIKEVTAAIIFALHEEFLRFPSTTEEWRVIANDFGEKWNFHHTIGAMDGKHCLIDPPLGSGSMYYNYKGQYSVVLLALVDAQLRFSFIDVITNGRVSDSGVWNKSTLKYQLDRNGLNFPPPALLPGTNEAFPYVIVGDEGFPLTENLLIPYPGPQCSGRKDRRIFNYRLSRARRCSENAFGVLGARFQIYRSPMRYDPDDARNIIIATCMHNMLRSQSVGRAMYTPASFLDEEDIVGGEVQSGDWRGAPAGCFNNFVNQGGNRHGSAAIALRDKWCTYFNTVGAVAWQERQVH